MKLFYTPVRRLVLLFVIIITTSSLFGQISIIALPYVPGVTNFNTYNPNSAANLLATIPAGWTATTAGTSVYNGQGNGTTGTAGYWALGTVGEYCLGSIPSSASDNITYTVSFTNNSGSTITTLAISWDYEQWRFGANSDLLVTGTGALVANATLNAQDYNDVAGTNGTVSTTSISIVLTGLSITNGTAFGITWVASNTGSGAADNGIGIDNFNIVASRTDATNFFRSKQNGNWNSVSTWESSTDNITFVNSSLTPDNTANTITILNGHTVTVTASVSTDQTTINSGGQITVNAGQTFTIADGTGTDLIVDGTVVNSGTITPAGTIQFNAAGTYQHAQNGGTIPTSTWNVTSNCNVTGVTNLEPSGLGQTFGNFTWNCAGHSTLITLDGALTAINGNFIVSDAGNLQGVFVENGLSLTSNNTLNLSIGGNFVISNAIDYTWLMLSDGNGAVTVTVGGDFIMSGSSSYFLYHFANTSSVLNTIIMDVAGNFIKSNGLFDFAYQTSTGATNQSILYVGGNFSHTGGSMRTSTTDSDIPNGEVIFDKAGTQTVTITVPANISYTNYRILSGSTVSLLSNVSLSSQVTPAIWGGKFVVNTGGTIDMNEMQIISSTGATAGLNNEFVLNSGTHILTANTNGIQNTTFGSISTSIATRTFSSGANYTYDGTVTQNSGIFTTTPVANQVNNLTINNSAGSATTGVTLQQAIAVNGTLTLSNGLLTTSIANLLTINAAATVAGMNYATRVSGGSNNSFVNGIMRKIGNTDFIFPVGKLNAGHRLCGISAPSVITDAFDAEFMRASGTALGPITAVGLAQVSNCEYWRINRMTGTSAVDITLSWSAQSNCNFPVYVSNLATLVIAHFGISWDSYGANSTTGNVSAGTITWNGVSTYNAGNTPFVLGSTNPLDNPLPVKFTSVNAYKIQTGNKVEWTNQTEEAVSAYELERSVNGRTFNSAFTQQARMNNGGRADYNWIDASPFTSITYYRIKATDRTGAVTYSPIVKAQSGGSLQEGLVVYPNPVVSHQFTMQLTAPAALYKVKLVNNFGQQVMQTQWQHAGGMISRSIELPASVSAGYYYLQITGGGKTQQTKIAIQ